MSLGQHLVELRKRLMIAAAALVVAMVAAFYVTGPVIELISIPIVNLDEKFSGLVKLNFATVTSSFDLRLRISFAVGLLISAPIWLWQLWAFIMPGLTRKEVRVTVGFIAAAVPLFFLGCAAGFLIIPHMVELLTSFAPEGSAQLLTALDYYDLVFKLMLALGCAFVLPVFLVGLNFAGIVSGRTIMKGWRVAILVATLFSAVTTPAADLVSMFLLAGILVVLFFAAAGLSMLFDRRRAGKLESLDPPQTSR